MGAVRMQKKLMELAGSDDKFSLFRSHPPSKDRAAELATLIGNNEQAKPLLAQEMIALNLPDSDDEDDDTAVAAAPSTSAGDRASLVKPLPASLEPIQGFSLERYAAYVNELSAAGDAGEQGIYRKYQLTEASSQKLNDAWVERMQKDTGLTVAYGRAYLEASVGPKAAWGKAAAQAKYGGPPVTGEPPISQADWIELSRLQTRLYTQNKDYTVAAAKFAEATQAKGLSPYDFQVASAWWHQLAGQNAKRGDLKLLQSLASKD
jgi:hypothetical protein